jgi:cytoskeletal protein RodZ
MDTSVLIWIIVAIVVVALIAIGIWFFMRGRTEQRKRAEYEKAEKLREEARQKELSAREGEARAAQAKADAASAAAAAQQAQARAAQQDIEAQRLADSVGDHEAEAARLRAEQEQTLARADKVDPYVTNDGSGNRTTADGRSDMDRDGRADANEVRRTDAERTDAPVADRNASNAPEQPITRPPASRPVPTVSQNDAAVEDVQTSRGDRSDRV